MTCERLALFCQLFLFVCCIVENISLKVIDQQEQQQKQTGREYFQLIEYDMKI